MVHVRTVHRFPFQLDLSLLLMLAMLLWIAGGASRADVMGQVIVRAGCWTILIIAILAGARPDLTGSRSVLLLLAATILLPLIQLVPLPPSWWQALPGRAALLVPGEPIPWRPWTMTPGATRNAVASLIVPATMLVILTQARERARTGVATGLLVMIGAAMLLGLLQFSGARFSNPFVNDTPGVVSSVFANRNHFATMLAIGCLLAPVWAFMDRDAFRWRAPLAAGLVLLFVLTILGTGSRSGMLLGGVALGLAWLLVAKRLRQRMMGGARWLFPALAVVAVLVIGGFVALSFAADRADAINRLISLEGAEDMRARARPTVLSLIRFYAPFGSGFGGFDPIFRIHEPFGLLKLTYFNEAHNDFLGVVLDGGLAALALLVGSIGWWLVATVRVWRMKGDESVLLGRLGSAIILLVLAASLTDYPARTPIVMAILVIAGLWLAWASSRKSEVALPS